MCQELDDVGLTSILDVQRVIALNWQRLMSSGQEPRYTTYVRLFVEGAT